MSLSINPPDKDPKVLYLFRIFIENAGIKIVKLKKLIMKLKNVY